ncbi:MAG TPA: hypothetical protein VJZ76_01595 [Thermoanaerobaculia bacterium]|nr:hypothetical protein [Thermoanaerobaculia bacterium]
MTSHHRWNSQTEFAVDFFQLGENGLPWKTDGRSAEDYFGYGAPVLAAADGIVVATENDAVQNYDVRLRQEGESEADGPDPLTARSIPFAFDDLLPPGGDYGKVVRTGTIAH